ncbi:hypothetical protein [Streptomyces rhizosphaericus]|uniref:hypothetical protein n=1 Tax=Streptomyces rhizosphaericus TaxID=114699 RepID=UPI00117BE703|nr:hypothetical protein [Streptomyces rhizosphaericus]
MNCQPQDGASPAATASAARAVDASTASGPLYGSHLNGDQVEALTRLATAPAWENAPGTQQLLRDLADGSPEREDELNRIYRGELPPSRE